MDPARAAEDLESFLAARGGPLLRTAALLTGDADTGEDLLQAALERLLRHWHRIDGDPEGYLRRTLYHLAADGWRRQGAWRRRLPLLAAGRVPPPDRTAEVDLRDAVVRLLRQLPPRQRAAIVARYWEGLTEAETAQAMGCSIGTVKSAVSRGMRRLRELSESWDGEPHGAKEVTPS